MFLAVFLWLRFKNLLVRVLMWKKSIRLLPTIAMVCSQLLLLSFCFTGYLSQGFMAWNWRGCENLWRGNVHRWRQSVSLYSIDFFVLLYWSCSKGFNILLVSRNAFRDELALLQKIRHPNVVQFLGAVTQSTPMMIVTEYLPKVLFFLNLYNHIQRMYDLSIFTNSHLSFKIHHEHFGIL